MSKDSRKRIFPTTGIVQGDCLEVLKNLPADFYSGCITDPPYNYEFVGHKWNHQEVQRRLENVANSNTLVKNIPYGSGLAGGVRNAAWYKKNRTNILEYQKWVETWGLELYRVLKHGSYVAIFNSTRTAAHVQVAMENVGFYARDTIVWRRHSGIPKGLNLEDKLRKLNHPNPEIGKGLHSALRSEWEAITLIQKPLTNNYFSTFLSFGTGLMKTTEENGKGFQSNILEGLVSSREETNIPHPTVKPLSLMTKLVDMLIPNDGIVIDPFAGSGTTLVAAETMNRPYLGIEILPDYVDLINLRLEKLKS